MFKRKPGGRPFVKGDPRIKPNRNGRPPAKRCIPDLLRWSGDLPAPEALVAEMRRIFGLPPTEPLTVNQATALRCRLEALKGSHQHLQFIADRTEGKAPERLAIEGGAIAVVEEIVDGRQGAPAPGAAAGPAPSAGEGEGL
jgi:hypothetical protein